MYCLDTNVLIDFWNKKPGREKYFLHLDNVFIPHIVAGEFLQGARDRQEQRRIQHFLSHLEIRYGDATVAHLGLELLAEHSLKEGITLMDSLIAAAAITEGAVFVTANAKHFRKISGLQLEAV